MSKLAKLVPIQLDKPRNLLLNMNAMIEFENATGMDFLEFSGRMERRATADARKAAWESGKTTTIVDGKEENIPAPNPDDLLLPDLSMKELRAMLWCLLVHEDDKLTLKQVGSLLDLENMTEICGALVKAQQINAPKPEQPKSEAISPQEDNVPLAPAPSV